MATVEVDLERGLPASVEAERMILGAILLANESYYEASEQIEPEDFSLDSHQRIFWRMSELMDSQCPVDLVTLCEHLNRHKEIMAVGGVSYLASLTEGMPRRPAIREYVRIVRDKALARQSIRIFTEAISRTAEQSEPTANVLNSTMEDVQNSMARDSKRSGRSIGDILGEDGPRFEREASAPFQGILGASLFTPDISRITCGIQPNELCLLCARPHQGKTEAAIQTIIENARLGLRVHFFSLEMKAYQIVRRMARFIAEVPIKQMRDPRCLTPSEKARLKAAREVLAQLPIVIDDTHELTVTDYRSRCVLAAKRWQADLIVTDYAQLLLVPKAKNGIETAQKQAETLRHIARDYCRTLALAQLRRAPPNDLNRYPDIEDIYGSSAFEQAAQMILMLHRERKDKRYTKRDFCIVGKMRELQEVQPLGIKAADWGGFCDRHDYETVEAD
jgi:replicative DNA helicase